MTLSTTQSTVMINMFDIFFKSDKRIEKLENRVAELESGIVNCVKLMKLQSEAISSIANEIVNLSNAMKVLAQNKSSKVNSKNEDHFH